MGRPTDSPKTNNYRIRMTDEELLKLEECCNRMGLSKANVIRLGIDKVYMDLENKK
ncbi:MAG: hypothetical protein NC307_01430 [Roseburia sp.]|nr:hypothetical protein [Roseburia sp.]